MTAEAALSREEGLWLMARMGEWREQLRALSLIGREDSTSAAELRANLEAAQARLRSDQLARSAAESERSRQEQAARAASERRERAAQEGAAAAIAFLEPLLTFPVAKTDIIARAEKEGIDHAALRVALKELDVRDVGTYDGHGRLGGGSHWVCGGPGVIAGYGLVGPATL